MKPAGSDVSEVPVQAKASTVESMPPADVETPTEVDAETPTEVDAETPTEVDADALTERELEMLAFEQRWWKRSGAKEQAIRDTFELSATRYYQLLNGLLDNPAALAHDPVLVGRLRRLRSRHAR